MKETIKTMSARAAVLEQCQELRIVKVIAAMEKDNQAAIIDMQLDHGGQFLKPILTPKR